MPPNSNADQINVGDVRRLAEGLGSLVARVDSYRVGYYEGDPLPYRSPSPAAKDDLETPGGHIHDLLGFVGIWVAGALESGEVLARYGVEAATGAATPAFAPMTIARSAIEALAAAHWLVAEGPQGLDRAGRILTVRNQELRNQERLPGLDRSEHRNEIRATADELQLRQVGRGQRRGFGSEAPTRTRLVSDLLGSTEAYSLLSAVSHGESWALIVFGFSESAERSEYGPVMVKAPPASSLGYPILQVMKAFAKFSIVEAEYRGWDATAMRELLREAFRRGGQVLDED